MINNLDYELKDGCLPAIIMLHGWGMDKNSFKQLVHKMRNNHKVCILDFFGFGKSEQPKEFYDVYEYAYELFIFLNKNNLKKVILVGHSFGGRISIILSSIFDIDVKYLILTSSAGFVNKSIKNRFKIWRYKIIKFLRDRNILKNKSLDKYGSNDYKKLNSIMKKVFVRVVNQDLGYLLRHIKNKTYLVWCKNDKDTPFVMCKKFNKKLINAERKIILYKNGGHFTYLYNSSKFAKLIDNCAFNTE